MKKLIPILAAIVYVLTYCGYEKISLPKISDTVNVVFEPGKMKYIPVNPPWEGEPYNFDNPVDIFISVDDYIFVCDSGNARVVVLKKTGEIVEADNFGNDFTTLCRELKAWGKGELIYPTGINVDSKLNIFITNSSNEVYVWNQFINNVGVDSIASAVIYWNPSTGEERIVTDFSETEELENNGFSIKRGIFELDSIAIDSIRSLHVFYRDVNYENSSFYAVASAPFGENKIYLTDKGNNRVAVIKLVRSAYLKLKNGVTLWQHKGVFEYDAAVSGTGAGTVNDPRGIFVDNNNNIYYTQLGENFGVHKIRLLSTGKWISVFSVGVNEIMNLDMFDEPFDVAVSNSGNILVTNTGKNEVLEFDSQGNFLRKAGIREVQVDTTVIDTIVTGSGDTEFVQRDTLITRYYNDVLNRPKALFYDDEILYIVDSGNNRILRYKLSSDIDIEIPE